MNRMETVEGYRALVVPVDGPVREVVIADRDDSGLADMYALIGCSYVEHVAGPGCSLWVDEEGAVSDPPLPPNPRIDALLQRADGWLIRGTVLITGTTQADGSTASLSSQDAQRLLGALGAVA